MTKNYAQQENLDQIEHDKWLESQDDKSLDALVDGLAPLMLKASEPTITAEQQAQEDEPGAIEAEKVRRFMAR